MNNKERIVTGSSSVDRIKYLEDRKILEVEFKQATYHYFDVPEGVAQRAMDTEEPGKFVASEIKGKYRYQRVY